MFNFTRRNIRVFFRDRTAVFFSLLSQLIIIGLYILFLGDLVESSMEAMPGARFVSDSWIMAGLLAVGSVTASLGAYGVMIDDLSGGQIRDFKISPLKRSALAGGYILSALVIAIIINLIALVLAELYIIMNGGSLLTAPQVCQVLGLICLSALAASSLAAFLCSFFKTSNAFATCSTIVGTMIGFLTGIYIPIGNLPEGIQLLIRLFPPSHAGVLFRQVMLEEPIRVMFSGQPAQAVANFKESMGVTFVFKGWAMPPSGHVIVLLATTVVFFFLAMASLSRKMKS